MYDLVLSQLEGKVKTSLSIKLKTDKDPLKLFAYLDNVSNEILRVDHNKLSQNMLNKIDTQCTRKMLRGGAATIHPSMYGSELPESYSEANVGENSLQIDFYNLIARPELQIGGCSATPLFNAIQKYLRNSLKGKRVKTSAITSVSGMITHRIIYACSIANKTKRLSSFVLNK